MSVPILDENERLVHEKLAMMGVAQILKSRLPLVDSLNLILEKIVTVIPQADFGVIMVWDQSAGLFRPWASYGCDAQILKRIGLRAGESITGKVFDDGQPLLLNTPDQVTHTMENMRLANRTLLASALHRDGNSLSTVAALIATGKQKFGVLVLETFQGSYLFSTDDISFVQTLADLIALAIELSRMESRSDAIRQARETERMRSEALATLSHELRMPLTTIKGYTTMLLMDEIQWSLEECAETLQLIDEECDSMQMMIKNILDSSLIDVNQIPIEPQPLRLLSIARDVANEIQRGTETHRLIVDFPKEFPLVNADPRWIKQVFRNILDNAIKYSPDGGLVVIRGEVRTEDVVIVIADQGIGISPEDLIPLFEKYFRVRSPHTKSIPGAGLGLPIARAIIEMHGGRIWADSRLQQGTTVHFSLPILKPQTGPLGSHAERFEFGNEEEEEPWRRRNLKTGS